MFVCLMEWDACLDEWYLVCGKFGTPRDDGRRGVEGKCHVLRGDLEDRGVGHLEEGGNKQPWWEETWSP